MKKFLFNKICIVGVGLIGGSLGIAIKKRKLAKLVVGVVRRARTAKEAMKRKAIDVATFRLKEGVRNADLVILSAPVSAIIRHLKEIAPVLKKNALVIDVGSSKQEIEKVAKKYLRGRVFVGCHPMAGSEKCGIEFADGNLFEGSICFMTQKNAKVETFWKKLGSRPLKIDPDRHDAWVAQSSHLPHALSFSLFQSVNSKYAASPSLKDMGRLAKSDPELWTDIFLSNRSAVLKALSKFKKNLAVFEKNLRQGRKSDLLSFIRHANKRAS